MKQALYAWSFDPITHGHKDITERAAKHFDKVTVGIGVNPDKEGRYLFSLQERLHLTREVLKDILNVDVLAFRGMLSDFAYENKYPVVVRGIRNGKDFEMEQELQWAIERQKLGIETFFLNAKQSVSDVSSSAVKSVLKEQGDIKPYAPLIIKQAMEGRLLGQYIAGVTWSVGSGKSFTTDTFMKLCEKNGITWHNLDLDKIGHEIQWPLQEPIYQETRQRIIQTFGDDVANEDGTINRENLGPKVFWDAKKLEELNAIMHDPMRVRTRRLMYNQKGLFFYNAALIAENNASNIVNNNIVLVNVDPAIQAKRLEERWASPEDVTRRLKSQFTTEYKKSLLLESIKKDEHGLIIDLQTPYINQSEKIAFNALLAQIDTFGELRFSGLLNRLWVKENHAKLFAELRNMYDRPISPDANRDEITQKIKGNYHKRLHIIDSSNEFYKIRHLIKNPDIIECAILFHDIIYDPTSKTNEEDSANFAENILIKRWLPKDFIEEVKRYILLTKHDKIPDTEDGKYLVDIDTSILWRERKKYEQYAKDIRREYYMYSDNKYNAGRKNVLKFFLEKENIFQTEHFQNKYKDQAKTNIEQEISSL